MNKIDVYYKNRKFIVSNPGEILYSKNNIIKKSRGNLIFEIVDQLNDCSELDYNKKEYSNRIEYLNVKYNLTELDYYIVVVCFGNENLLPRCSYINPYTGEKCNEVRKFRTLVPEFYQKTGNRQEIFYLGCEKHKINAAAQNSQRENYRRGITGLQKANRKSKVWREKLRDHAKRQIEEGRSIFSPDDIRDKNIPSWKSLPSNPSINYYKVISKELNLSLGDLNLENCILIDKLSYLRKGDKDDICYYYISSIKDNESLFKLGVTNNPDKRIKDGIYHGLKYEKMEILIESTREKVAEIEYQVKLKFKSFIEIGNEIFNIDCKESVLEFIEYLKHNL